MVSALLGILLYRTIVVGAVLVALKFLSEGLFVLTAGIALPLVVFAYLLLTEARVLR